MAAISGYRNRLGGFPGIQLQEDNDHVLDCFVFGLGRRGGSRVRQCAVMSSTARNLIGAAVLAVCAVTRAQAGEHARWNEIATTINGQDRFDVKVGSLITTPRVALITARDVDLHSNEINFRLMGIALQSCARQMGLLHVFDVRGNLLYSQDFVFGGESVAAQIAETICDLAQSHGAHTRAPVVDL